MNANNELVSGNHYKLLFFRQMPDTKELGQLAQAGIQLLEYISTNAYLAAIPETLDDSFFENFPVKTIQTITQDWQLSSELKAGQYPDWAISKNKLQVILKFHKNLSHADVIRFCEKDRIEVLSSNGINNFLRVQFPINRLSEIATLPYIAHLDLVAPPSIPDDQHGKAMHRSNVLNTQYPTGRHYDGFGVGVLCRDDGMVGPHIDFNGRLDNSFVENPNSSGGKHGDGVCGIIGGAGNLHPRREGMAPASNLYTIDYEADFLDETMDMHMDKNVLITNSSYSNGCNAGYTVITETVDQQLFNYPTLMHVFSAGNSNNLDCGYGAGNQWGNITGGHKQAKNCITVGNLQANGTLASTSSRGPTKDGRIKPDLAAFGEGHISTNQENTYQVFGGTSAAAPGVAGVLAQLHQAYRTLNNGNTAEAALLKACLLNTANDLGNPGPDFKYGWGQVNALRAVETLEQNHFLESTISQGQTKTHSLTIPNGIVEARIMIYWHDIEASTVASKALVNNLDSRLIAPNGQSYLPWLLDPTANPVNLDAPAGKGIDNLNNMEQVTIANPMPGEYSFEVFGKEMPFGQLSYFVVWEFRTASVKITHPIGGEAFAPGDTLSIQWDATGTNGSFQISYSTDNGGIFINIANALWEKRMIDWIVPNTISGKVKVRINRTGTGESSMSEAPFSIAPLPKNLQVEQACPDKIKIKWDAVSFGNASPSTTYEVFLLGTKNMEIIGTTTETEFEVPTISNDPTNDHWIAVKAIGDNGLHSERTIAILYNGGLMACPQQHDLTIEKINSPNGGTIFGCGQESLPVIVEVKNKGMQTENNVQLAYQVNGGNPIIETFFGPIQPGQTKTYEFSKTIDLSGAAGISLHVYSILPTDFAAFNNHAFVDLVLALYNGKGEIPNYIENFEGPIFPPPFYAIENPDNDVTWDQREVIGSQGELTQSMFFNNYVYANVGQEDAFLVVPIDLNDAVNPVLKFDVAYAQYSSNYSDGMRVELSMDCGQTFNQVIFEKQGDVLATAENHSQLFLPNSVEEWRKETINLSSFTGHSIVLKFVNITGYGNSLFIDDISVIEATLPTAHFSASEIEICQGESIVFTNQSSGKGLDYLWQFGPTASPATFNDAGPIEVFFPASGTFSVVLTVSNGNGASSFSQIVKVKEPPVPNFDFTMNTSNVVFSNTSVHATSYLWDFGDGTTSTSISPTHVYSSPGIYHVELSAMNVCGTVTTSKTEIAVLINLIANLDSINEIRISPNPVSDVAKLSFSKEGISPCLITIHDARGVFLFSQTVFHSFNKIEIDINLCDFPTGLYMVEVLSKKDRKVVKLVVSH